MIQTDIVLETTKNGRNFVKRKWNTDELRGHYGINKQINSLKLYNGSVKLKLNFELLIYHLNG